MSETKTRLRRKKPTASEPWHGTDGGYTNHGCRRPCCNDAHNAAQADWVERNADRPIPEHIDPDSYEAYKYYGSKTPGARAANAERRRRQRENQRST